MIGSLPFLNAATVIRAAPIADLLDAVELAYRHVATGRDLSPLRSHVELPDSAALLLMPGVSVGSTGHSVKLVTYVPRNAARGLPTLHAIVVWLDATTGEPRALLDGGALTALRTGAASGVATRLLARTDARVLALLGAGGQAEWQLRAVCATRPIDEVRVYAPTPARRETLAVRMRDELGIRVIAAASAAEAVRGADVVCCATTSTEPVFEAAWLSPGAHVNAIGAFTPEMVELPPELFQLADLVTVDALRASLAEAGDVLTAISRGAIAGRDLVEIGSVEGNYAEQRNPTAITVFKSVGLAIQDVAAAELILRNALEA